MLRYALIIFLFFCAFAPFSAFATDIATCGTSSGYRYYANRNLIQKENVGWQKAELEGNKFSLKQSEDGQFDIIYYNPVMDGLYSSVADGAKVFPAGKSEDTLTIIAIHPKTIVETYVFQKINDGKNQVMWTQAKADTVIPNASAFISDCSYLNLEALK